MSVPSSAQIPMPFVCGRLSASHLDEEPVHPGHVPEPLGPLQRELTVGAHLRRPLLVVAVFLAEHGRADRGRARNATARTRWRRTAGTGAASRASPAAR